MMTLLRTILLIGGLIFSVSASLWAQYPDIPEKLEAEGDAYMDEVQRRSDEAWEKAWPVIEKEMKEGKPYIPWASIPKDLPQAKIPAFPGAEGGGMFTAGGRGGKVYVVSNLNDSGSGSLREALEAGGARIVVFNVAGIIQLKDPILVRAPYVTIAGQTAPGDGICVAGESVKFNTHDIIIRHMRFRRGETDVLRRDDALSGDVMGNIIIDHVSASWGLDETISMYRNMWSPEPETNPSKRLKLPTVNITIQNSLIAETLDTYNHAFGSTIGGLNSTFVRNLWANNIARNPSIGMWGDVGFVNNVIYNWWNRTMDGGDYRSMWNIINNYYKPGPITPMDKPIAYRIAKPETGSIDSTLFGRIYANGNIVEDNETVTNDNWEGGIQPNGRGIEDSRKYLGQIRSYHPFPMAPVDIMPAEAAYGFVLENVGATIPRRDPVDERIIKQVRTGVVEYVDGLEEKKSEFLSRRRLPADSYKKGIITNVEQVGGYPEYNGEPYTDADVDGMPDWWEEKYGLNPNDASDASGDINGDGYSNIEMFINGINPETDIDWTDLNNNYDTLQEKGAIHKL
jgi:hypothetical protein